MAASNPNAMAIAAILVLALQASPVMAARAEQQAVVIEAQSSEMDLKNNNLIYRKVRLYQGNMSIIADVATGTGVDFENSHWVFRGGVKITMETGLLTADEADITF